VVNRIRTAFLLLPLSGAPLAAGQPARVSAYAHTDSASYLVGDWITVHVDLLHPKGAVFLPVLGDSAGGFLVLERRPVIATSDTSSSAAFVVAKVRFGAGEIPPVDFSGHGPRRGGPPHCYPPRTRSCSRSAPFRWIRARTSAISSPPWRYRCPSGKYCRMRARSSLPRASSTPDGGFWKRRKARKSGKPDQRPPPRPAHEIAFEQLALLKEKKLWQQGLIKQYYSEATEIFRRYLENRYAMQAMEETTDEILAGLRKLRFPEEMSRDGGTDTAPGGPGEIREVRAGDRGPRRDDHGDP